MGGLGWLTFSAWELHPTFGAAVVGVSLLLLDFIIGE
jgi:hypothetical protein